jgi:hypothetical protein
MLQLSRCQTHVAKRLSGATLESTAEDENTTTELNIFMVEQVTSLVEKLASITAPYPGLITSTHGEGMDKTLCPSDIPMTMSTLTAYGSLPHTEPGP